MRARFAIIFFILLGLAGVVSGAEKTVIHDIRLWRAPDSTRIVFDLDRPATHVMKMESPTRLVLEVSNAELQVNPAKLSLEDTPISALKTLPLPSGVLLITLELRTPVKPKSFALAKNPPMDDRLVLDLFDSVPAMAESKTGLQEEADDIESILGKPTTPGAEAARKPAPATKMVIDASRPAAGKPEKVAPVKTVKKAEVKTISDAASNRRNLIIAIDAGHGGEDPGASGPGRIREKDVVLKIAKKLENRFKKELGYTPVMIRKSDYYVGLSQRRDLARKANADMFVSIHADAFTRPTAHGSSVYALSSKGATSASAQFLADKENQSDLIGGVSLDDKDAVLSSVLIDLSMTYKMESSLDVGASVLRKVANVSKLHSNRVEQAAFAVLKTPDIPSILVETGFISNKAEAKKLNSSSYQQQLADAIFDGIDLYFQRKAPEDSYIAWKQKSRGKESLHVVSKGETLSQIARLYAVNMSTIIDYNRLSNTDIRIGQHLKIPASNR